MKRLFYDLWLDGGKTRNYLFVNIIEIEYYNL